MDTPKQEPVHKPNVTEEIKESIVEKTEAIANEGPKVIDHSKMKYGQWYIYESAESNAYISKDRAIGSPDKINIVVGKPDPQQPIYTDEVVKRM